MSLVKENKLNKDMFKRGVEQLPTRDGYGKGLVQAGEENENVVALSADLTDSTRTGWFKEKLPERFVEIGVAEQLLATAAAGMAAYGKIPFIASYAAFSPGRNWEQIRTTASLNDLPLKIAGCHAGVSVGPDGATHQALEDIATMRSIPNMVVIYPCDAIEAQKATFEASKNGKPTYLRFAREKTPLMTTEDTPFKIGQAITMWEEKDPQVAIIGAGPLLHEALKASKKLSANKISSLVINLHTIKPLDEQAIIKAAKLAGCVVTVEEHQVNGGLGGAVSEVLAKNFPVPMEFVGIQDRFGQSGEPKELLKEYGLTSDDVVKAAKAVIKRKNK